MFSYIKTVPVFALLSLLPLSVIQAEDFSEEEMSSGGESSEMGDFGGDESANSGMDSGFEGSDESGMGGGRNGR